MNTIKKIKCYFVLVALLTMVLVSSTALASGWLTNEKGVKIWSSSESIAGESFKWSGKVVNGYAEGKGKLELFSDGKLSGRYEGDMHEGKRQGYGVFTWVNGNRYEGEFKDNRRTGKGTFTYSDRSVYTGDFVDGMKQGKGVYTWKDGSKYDGEWYEDKQHGYGTEYISNDSILFRGQWRNGVEYVDKSSSANVYNTNTIYDGNGNQIGVFDKLRSMSGDDGSTGTANVYDNKGNYLGMFRVTTADWNSYIGQYVLPGSNDIILSLWQCKESGQPVYNINEYVKIKGQIGNATNSQEFIKKSLEYYYSNR